MRKIGSVCLIFFFTTALLCAQGNITVELQIRDAQGARLQQAGIGQPFMVHVIVQGHHETLDDVTLVKQQGLSVRQQGSTQRMTSVGGQTTQQTTVHYVVRADEPGEYTIGPATVLIDGYQYDADPVSIAVAQEQATPSAITRPLLTMEIENDRLVVGQTVPLRLRFYHLDAAQLQKIIPPEIPGFALGSLQGPSRGRSDIEGVLYDYVEWRVPLTAQQEGSFVIKPAHAIYGMPSRHHSTLFQMLSDHFSFGMQEYETQSNATKLTVDPLPFHDGPVHGVGTFSRLHATVNNTVAKEGEGVVYRLELIGDESVRGVTHPTLELPETLTAYDSKSSVLDNRYSQVWPKRKLFEYIIQAREPERQTIPAQTFTFYDPSTRAYKKLTTHAIVLDVLPDPHAAPSSATQQKEPEQVASLDDSEQDKEPENSPHTFKRYVRGTWYAVPDTGFSPIIMWIALFGLLIAYMVQWTRFFWAWYTQRNYQALRARSAFYRARTQLTVCRRSRDAHKLYGVFVTLFADRYSVSKEVISAQKIDAWLTKVQMPAGMHTQWHTFFTQLQAYAFYDQGTIPPDSFFDEAHNWLKVLEKWI